MDMDLTDFFAEGFSEEDTTEGAEQMAVDSTEDTTEVLNTEVAGGAEAEGAEDTTETAEGEVSADTTDDESEGADKNTEGKSEEKSVYTLKVRGREQSATMPELIGLAQKGADYDRVRERYDDIKDEAYRLRELAEGRGKTVNELLDELANMGRASEVQATAEKLAEGGLEPQVAEMLAEMLVGGKEQQKMAASKAVNDEEALLGSAAAEDGLFTDNGIAESIQKLVDVYGVTELPEEVTKLSVDKGFPPFEAYQAWLISEGKKREADLQQQLAAERKNADNRERSVGSLVGGVGGASDAFLAGFNME